MKRRILLTAIAVTLFGQLSLFGITAEKQEKLLVDVFATRDESKIIDKLKEWKIDPNYEFKYHGILKKKGYILHMAVLYGLADVLEYLIKQGADVKKETKDKGKTALHYLAEIHVCPRRKPSFMTMAKALFKAGADENARDAYFGYTPLHSAALAIIAYKKDETRLLDYLTSQRLRQRGISWRSDGPATDLDIRSKEGKTAMDMVCKGSKAGGKTYKGMPNSKACKLLQEKKESFDQLKTQMFFPGLYKKK